MRVEDDGLAIEAAYDRLLMTLRRVGAMQVDGEMMVGVDHRTYSALRSLPRAEYTKVKGGDAVCMGNAYFGLIHEEK